jgi:hypothetical protein
MSEAATLHVMQMSLRFNVGDDALHTALHTALDRAPDVVGFTECRAHQTRPVVLDVCRAMGYRLHGGPGDTAVAVAQRHPLLDFGNVFVNPAEPGPAAEGGHGARYIDWSTFRFHHSVTTLCEAHWVTRHPDSVARRREHRDMTQAMIREVEQHGHGPHLAFFAGDVNVDEATDRATDHALPGWMFGFAGLTTIYDELHRYPDTAGDATLDIIGSYDYDRRVTGCRVHVWPKSPGLDHQQVSAWYDIKRL